MKPGHYRQLISLSKSADIATALQVKKQTVSALMDVTFRKHVINKTTPKQPKRRTCAALTTAVPKNPKTTEILRQMQSAAPSAQWNRYTTEVPRPAKERQLIEDTEDLSKTSLDIMASRVSSATPLSEDERDAVCKSTL
ncbi:hypothetical protein ISCGN_022094 [Ixodes scapularis]